MGLAHGSTRRVVRLPFRLYGPPGGESHQVAIHVEDGLWSQQDSKSCGVGSTPTSSAKHMQVRGELMTDAAEGDRRR